jgi:hypothetical protein
MVEREVVAVRADMLGYCPDGHGRGHPFEECEVCGKLRVMEWSFARWHLDKHRHLDPMDNFRDWARRVMGIPSNLDN